MINLSNFVPSQAQYKLLGLGLKYIPKTSTLSKKHIQKSYNDFERRIHLQFFWHNKTQKNSPGILHQFIKSDWSPPISTIDINILNILEKTKHQLYSLGTKHTLNNIQKTQHRTLQSLKKIDYIIFKSADKGASIVIQNKQNYLLEAKRQLANQKHYLPIQQPTVTSVLPQINLILKKLLNCKYINFKEYIWLLAETKSNPRLIYFLPKIHKKIPSWTNLYTPTARPITSDLNSPTYHISRLIDLFLKPFATTHPSYVKDTPHFLQRLKSTSFSPNCHLITLDVSSLYTNIKPDLGIQYIKKTLELAPNPNRPDSLMLQLIELCLKHNDFYFHNQLYLQICGISMGLIPSPHIADIFLAQLEKQVLNSTNHLPSLYIRYLDDIFIIWEHPINLFDTLLNEFNNHCDSIKFTPTIHTQQIPFLDIIVHKGPQFQLSGILDTKTFLKPTDTQELLHKKSFHPQHTFKGILKSQTLRYHRNSSNTTSLHNSILQLHSVLKTRGYTTTFLNKIKRQTLHQIHNKNQNTHTNTTLSHCNTPTCSINKYFNPNPTVTHLNNTYTTTQPLSCESSNLIYSIQCFLCKKLYIGQTSQTLRNRITAHISNIKNHKPTTLAKHINKCTNYTNPNIIPIIINPLFQIPILTDQKLNNIALLTTETKFIKQLNTMHPYGINLKSEAPPNIPFIYTHSESSPQAKQIILNTYQQIQIQFPHIYKSNLISAYRRPKNIKDFLIQTKYTH